MVGFCTAALIRRVEVIGSGGQVNRPVDELRRQRLPAVDLSHVDLAGGKQSPKQHRRRVGRGQHRLRFDPPLELLVEALDSIRGSGASPLRWWQAGEGEQGVPEFGMPAYAAT